MYRDGPAPGWLTTTRVIRAITGVRHPRPYDAACYDAFACAVDERANAYLIERLARDPDRPAPPLADLIRTASLRQQGWMEWKAALADGMQIGTAFLPPHEALRATRVVARRLVREPLPGGTATRERDLAAGLLRCASGARVSEIAAHLGIASSTALRAAQRHDAWMRTSPRYSDLVTRALQSAVRRAFGPRRHALELSRRVGSTGIDDNTAPASASGVEPGEK
jgi:hypothetical protein